MWNREDIYLILSFIIVISSSIPGGRMVKIYGHPAEGDAGYHFKLVKAWLNGENPLFRSYRAL